MLTYYVKKMSLCKGSLASLVEQESGFPARDRRGSALLIWAALALLTQTAREIFLVLRNLGYPHHVSTDLSVVSLLSKTSVKAFNVNDMSIT